MKSSFTSKRALGLGLAATVILFIANVAFFLSRGMEDSYYPTTYATIYYPTDRPVILEWTEIGDGIQPILNWNAPVEGWTIMQDGSFYSENEGPYPFIPTPEGDTEFHDYTAVPVPAELTPPLELQIRFLPESFHANRGLPRPDTYLIRSDIPTGDFDHYSVSQWVDDYEYMSDADLAYVDDVLANKVGIRPDDSVVTKLEKLMVHFRNELGQSCRGTPPADFRWKTPLQIYREMDSGVSKGWCTQHAQMYVFFANRAGLSTRLIQGARLDGNNFVLTGHTWVEAWIPEQAVWAWVEPSFSIAFAKDRNGRFLNTVELANLRQHSAWQGVTGRVFKDFGWPDLEGEEGTWVDADFEDVGGVVERQFITSAIYKWRRPPNVEDLRYDYGMLFKNSEFFWGNVERYYFKPPLALANFPTDGAQTYWIRHLLLWGFLVSLAVTIVLAVGGRRHSAAREMPLDTAVRV